MKQLLGLEVKLAGDYSCGSKNPAGDKEDDNLIVYKWDCTSSVKSSRDVEIISNRGKAISISEVEVTTTDSLGKSQNYKLPAELIFKLSYDL